MIILRDILEDFLYFPSLTYSLEESLSALGLNVIETRNFANKYAEARVVRIKSYEGFDDDKELHHYLDNFSENIYSKNELEVDDIIVVKDSNYIYEYSEFEDIPFLSGEGVVRLPSFYNYGTSLGNSLNIAYVYYEIEDNQNRFDSYYSLAQAIAKKDDFPFLEPEIINTNSIQEMDKPQNFSHSIGTHNLVIMPEETNIPSWLMMRLSIHGISPKNLAEAINSYIKLEYNFDLDLNTFDNYFIYSANEKNDKAFARVQELWEQTCKIQAFKFI